MTFFGKRPTDLLPADIVWIVKAEAQEGIDLEFKRALAAKDGGEDRWVSKGDAIGEHAKRDLIRELVGFANSRGGTLILGIKETKEKPSRAEAVTPVPRAAELADRLKMVCRELIEPALHNLEIAAIPLGDDGAGVVVFQVSGRSIFGPHRHRSDRECYVRRNDETVPMDMHEIRRLSIELSSALRELDEQLTSQRSKLDRKHDFSIRSTSALVAHVSILPLSPISVSDVHRNEALRPRIEAIPIDLNGRQSSALFPIHGALEWHPIVRGSRGLYHMGNRSNVAAEFHNSGACSLEWAFLRGEENAAIYIGWLVGIFANALLFAERIRRAARTPNLPFALQFILKAHNPAKGFFSLLPYEDHQFITIGSVTNGTHEFPKYEVQEASYFNAATQLFENDLVNLSGQDFPDSNTRFDFSAALANIDRAFASSPS